MDRQVFSHLLTAQTEINWLLNAKIFDPETLSDLREAYRLVARAADTPVGQEALKAWNERVMAIGGYITTAKVSDAA